MQRGTQRQSATRQRGKSCTMPQVYGTLRRFGCGMPFDAARPKNSIGKLLVQSKEAVRHMMSKGFQNGISQLEKKNQTKFADLFPQFW